MEPQVISIGEKLPGAQMFVPDQVKYIHSPGGHFIIARLSNPTSREIKDFRDGELKFGLIYEEDIVCLAYRFGKKTSGETLFTSHLFPEEERQHAPEMGPDERVLVTIILADAAMGIVKVIRPVTFSPEFSKVLHAALRRQAASPPITLEEYRRRGQLIQSRYPVSEALMSAASVRCRGGD